MNINLELWNSVEKTNPAYTKAANIRGNKITSIAPQYQIKNVTEKFGVYGKTWGFKSINIDYSLASTHNLVVFKGVFFFPGGEFEIINSISLYLDNAMTKVDDNFAKKLETDALTKAISKLGFNADVFLGLFDDSRYVDQMKQEFAPAKTLPAVSEKDLKLIEASIEKGTFDYDLLKQARSISPDVNKKITELLTLKGNG